MAFSRNDVDALLVQCHRCCCICHRFCGVKIETDHITPKADNGPDTIDNAIPVCFECHAEIHSYNDRHPRGRKFRPEELQCHKEQWLKVCQERPDLLLTARKNADVGPLQALIDELDFNARVALYSDEDQQGCLFERTQFRRAVSEGAISALDEKLRDAVLDAYVGIGRANQHILSAMKQQPKSEAWAVGHNRARQSIQTAKEKLKMARNNLLEFLSSEA